ncbi:MAG: hypothetical protein R3C03_11855 [Pirellulaceae bacterium]
MSVRETERMVTERIQAEDTDVVAFKLPKSSRVKNPQIESLQTQLRQALGTKVSIKSSKTGRGSIAISFANNEEFERIFEVLAGEQDINRSIG